MSKYRTADGSPLSAERIARLDEVEARIGDADDCPPAPEQNWATSVRGKFSRARKEAVALQLDSDVLDWLRRKSPEYQDEINRILREKMEAETHA
jgi:uncharacterized protein (DUF4415 family)